MCMRSWLLPGPHHCAEEVLPPLGTRRSALGLSTVTLSLSPKAPRSELAGLQKGAATRMEHACGSVLPSGQEPGGQTRARCLSPALAPQGTLTRQLPQPVAVGNVALAQRCPALGAAWRP